MNYFYNLPDDIINKILERKDKLEKIDELKRKIKWEKKELDRIQEEASDYYPVQECEYEDLERYELELYGIETDIMIEDEFY